MQDFALRTHEEGRGQSCNRKNVGQTFADLLRSYETCETRGMEEEAWLHLSGR